MRPLVIGLTGSIGMGKTTVAAMFRALGIPVHDSDAVVHRLLGRNGRAVAAVAREFPAVVKDGTVDRRALGSIVFVDKRALTRLESILHPMVREHQQRFLADARRRRKPLVVLDIPLLFETGGERRCDLVVVASAPPFVQSSRVLRRPGMTAEKYARILANQVPDARKRRLADFVVPTGLGKAASLRAVKDVVKVAKRRLSRHGRRM